MAVDSYIKIASVDGESSTKGFEKQIAVLAWSWGGSQSGSFHGGTSGAGAGKVNVQDLSFTKHVDKSSPVLFQKMCQGKHFDDAKLVCCKAGGDSPVKFMEITLKKVMVSNISVGGSHGEEQLTENITLHFESLEVKYTGQKSDGSADAPVTATWNIPKNAAS